MSTAARHASEDESRALAESSRQAEWAGRSFVRDLFLGALHPDWLEPWPETPESELFRRVYADLAAFLRDEVDSVRIDAEGQIGAPVLDGLRRLGVFGAKIPAQYGGLGLNQVEYCKLVELIASRDGNLAALVSAHQSIGLPQPLYLFGDDAQKQKYLPRCAAGAISAFALTEPDVGSDPARLATTARKTPEGDYVLDGEKLWITNATIAELMVVMARDPDTQKISAFIVETSAPGFEILHRCRFMGLKALENGWIRFNGVRIPKENLLGREGQGLKIALVTLNTGRLSLPAACVGGAREGLRIAREFAARRVQWGQAVGKHEAIAHKLAESAALTYAMESWSRLAAELSLRPGYDIRLEAATAKEWVSTRAWQLTDDLLQIRGGRGYETEQSLAARGEVPENVERVMRDSRINRIFEGSSEIMHLFMAREMVDVHLQVAGKLLDKQASVGEKVAALPKVAAFYAGWYPKQWFGLSTPFKHGKYGALAGHVRYAERSARRLARAVFHAMVWHGAKLEKKQALLFRTVDIAMELAVMTAAVVRAANLAEKRSPNAAEAAQLADAYCQMGRRLVDQRFRELTRNDDDAKYGLGRAVLDGTHTWLEGARIGAPAAAAPESVGAAAK